MDEYLGVTETARILGVDVATVRRWCERGKIAGASKLGPRAWAIPKTEVERLKVEYVRKGEGRSAE